MKKKILFVISLLFGLLFIFSGLNKLFMFVPPPPDLPAEMQKAMAAFGEIKWLMPLVAVVEIIGGVLVITNRFRALGAIVVFPAMCGILLFHIITAPSGLIMAVILMGINLWMMFENREKYMPMVK
jgi:putative oxidoreductase